MFRDESKTLSVKRQRIIDSKKSCPISKKAEKVSGAKDVVEISKSLSVCKPTAPTLSIELGNSAEDQATCFFFRNYVSEENEYHNGYFQYLSDIYATESIGSAMVESVTSLGMAGLSNFWHSPNIMAQATAKYNSALRLVSSRLRNVEEAKSDQTLIAVMLLGLYEVTLPLQVF